MTSFLGNDIEKRSDIIKFGQDVGNKRQFSKIAVKYPSIKGQ